MLLLLLLLLLLKLHIHNCAGAAAAVVVRHRVQDDAFFCCVFFAADSIVSFSLFKHDVYECTPWQRCRMYSLDLPVIIYSIIYVTHPRKLRAYAEPRRAAARRGEAPLTYCTISP